MQEISTVTLKVLYFQIQEATILLKPSGKAFLVVCWVGQKWGWGAVSGRGNG